jgi:hypothetical protein
VRTETPSAERAVDRRLYDAAVSHGIDMTGRAAEDDRLAQPARLLATATVHQPSLLLALSSGLRTDASRHLAHTLSAGLVRLAHHALAVHARDNGYDSAPWIAQAIAAGGVLTIEHDGDVERLIDSQHDAAAHLADAIVALSTDRMAFPDALAQAQGAWLACFRHVTVAGRRR